MKCKKCKKENLEGTKYCKYCGELLYDLITCSNGHQYNASEKRCPYCLPYETEVNSNELDNMKTIVIENTDNSNDYEKTNINSTEILLNQNFKDSDDKTILIDPDQSQPQLKKIQTGSYRKLIGWLITFDIDPNGKDFRLYEGKNTIGKDMKNDIVLIDPTVSNTHATILYRQVDKKLIIQDNLSTNGTFVNDELIEDKKILNDNDIIKIGKIKLKVKLI